MITTYKVTGYYEGVIYAMYKDGVLDMLLADLAKHHTVKNPISGWDMFPLFEEDLLNSLDKFSAKQIVGKTVGDKVALFCLKYKEHKGQPYRAGKEEKANLKLVTVTEQLLNTYLTAITFPFTQVKTMADYVRHYNAVRDLAANGKAVKSSFPDVYDKQYEQRLGDDVSKLQRYWAHLRERGWVKDDGIWKHKSIAS